MKIKRDDLLKCLRFARLGTPSRGETLEQSNSFVFTGGKLITFDDETKTEQPSPLPELECAVLADEFLKMMEKFPDEEVDLAVKGSELQAKGKQRSFGVTCYQEITLPFDAVPEPTGFKKLKPGIDAMLLQAARNCGRNEAKHLTTVVHVTPDMIEACDNQRYFRNEGATGFPKEVLLPASGIGKLNGLNLRSVALKDGWAHFRTEEKWIISIHCSFEAYHTGTDKLLVIPESSEVELPDNLAEVINRAVVMMDTEGGHLVRVKLTENSVSVESRKDSGWFKEKQKVKYSGEEIEFDINPAFFTELLDRTHTVQIGKKRMKVVVDSLSFVVVLVIPE